MTAIKVPTNFNIELEFVLPEFYRRVIALCFDILIEYFYLRIIANIIESIARHNPNPDGFMETQAIALLLLVPIFIYHPLMEITMNGQSIGKKIMGIRVVNEMGGRPGISQFLIRWLLRISDLWMAILLVLLLSSPYTFRNGETTFLMLAAFSFLITDIILVVTSKKRQRIGDILAGTIIVRTHTNSNIEETVFMEVAEDYNPSFPQVMQLTDRDMNAIKSILETARKKRNTEIAEMAANKIKNHLKIESSLPPFDFLEILMKDYNYLSIK